MDEKEIQESLAAMERAGKRAMASKEAATQFLMDAGILDEHGEVLPFFKDNVASAPPSSQPTRRVSRL